MVDNILNYIRSLIFSDDTRKRRAPVDDYDIPISAKVRRISPSQMLTHVEDDWRSTSSSGSAKRRCANLNSSTTAKSKPNWSKENITLTIDDDDDDILEISKLKPWTDTLKKQSKASHFTSTPNYSVSARASINRNGDDDVTLLKYTSIEDKKTNAKKHSLEYIKPYCLSDNQNKTRTLQNGSRSRDVTSPILSNIKEIKAKLNRNPRQPVRSAVLEQSFRLDEKFKYKQLLQQNTNCSAALRDSFSKYSTPVGRLFSFGSNSRGKKLVDMAIKGSKPTTYIDLTFNGTSNKPKNRLTTKETIKKVLDEFDTEPVVIKDSDSDVEILPTPPSPKPDIQVERVNSIKVVVDTEEHSHEDWLQNLIKKHKDEVAKCKRDICSQLAQNQKISEMATEVHAQRLENQMAKCLHIKDTVLPISVAEEPLLPELSDEDEMRIDHAISKRGNPNEIVAQKFNLNITRRDIQTLAGLNWLNDEVINFYMNLLIERGKDSKWPKTYAMNTFFYPKLQKDGPSSLRRWTRRVDIFSHDIIAVPIHLGVHWCMSIIDFRTRSIKYFDSMGSPNRQCLEALLDYLQAEHLDKKQKEYDVSDWDLENVQDIPQQMNGSDCGMFACTFAEFLTRNAKITFSQEDMPYLRRKMVLEILNGELLVN